MQNKPINVFVASGYGYHGYASWILSMNRANNIEKDITKCNLILLPGGSDISPALYGEEAIKGTCTNEARDIHELKVAEYAIKHGIPILGTCRGLMWSSLNGVNSGNAEMQILSQAIKEIL